MRTIDVGILLSETIGFSLIGTFLCDGIEATGENSVTVDGYRVKWNGNNYDRLIFTPQESDSHFTLHNVVIGIDFHWERCEEQSFRGELHLFMENGKVRAVNRIAVEEYLTSVISSEMSATSSLQLLKAHAVISRSWLYAQLDRKAEGGDTAAVYGWKNDNEIIRWYARDDHELFDFCADDHCQRYQGITKVINPDVLVAVKETEHKVLAYEGCVCDARFSKCCGGITEQFSACWEDESIPYLASFRDTDTTSEPFDASSEKGAREWIEGTHEAFCSAADTTTLSQVLNGYDRETNDFHRWTVEYTSEELSQLVRKKSGIDFGEIYELTPMKRGKSGRIVLLKITGSKATVTVGKELEIRKWLSTSHLYSSAFVVDKTTNAAGETIFRLKGAGWGHGVGLCQIGAAVMSKNGYDYSAILSHYYPGAELKNIIDIYHTGKEI